MGYVPRILRQTAPPMNPDQIATLKAIGNCELLVDALAGMTHDGTHVTALTDLSGNGVATTLGAGAAAPFASSTRWNGSLPGMGFVNAVTTQYFTAPINIPHPFSVVAIIKAMSGPAGGAYLWSSGAGGQGFSLFGSGSVPWRAFFGTGGPYNSTGFDTTTSLGKYCAMVCVTSAANGAGSVMARSGTEETGSFGGSMTIDGTLTVGSAPAHAGFTGITTDLASLIVYSKLLTVADRAAILLTSMQRWGVSPV